MISNVYDCQLRHDNVDGSISNAGENLGVIVTEGDRPGNRALSSDIQQFFRDVDADDF
ncbi:hypothetical protein Q0M94_20820 (plasmid) [Deinococcus radiomollis]